VTNRKRSLLAAIAAAVAATLTLVAPTAPAALAAPAAPAAASAVSNTALLALERATPGRVDAASVKVPDARKNTSGKVYKGNTTAPKSPPPAALGKAAATAGSAITALAPCPGCYFYNSGTDWHSAGSLPTGFYANFTVHNPTLDTANSDNHTIAEIAVEKQENGDRQIVEVGWAVNQTVFGNTNTRLFAGHWVNDTFGGWNSSCTDWGGTAPNLGDTLTVGVAQKFGIVYSAGDWWVWIGPTSGAGGDWICYFDGALWTGATPAVNSFTDAEVTHAFGEVNADNDPTCTDMGDGVLGSSTTGAVIGSTTNVGGATSAMTWGENPTYPDFEIVGLSARTARYGGPGC
jgi:hypothetical protein